MGLRMTKLSVAQTHTLALQVHKSGVIGVGCDTQILVVLDARMAKDRLEWSSFSVATPMRSRLS